MIGHGCTGMDTDKINAQNLSGLKSRFAIVAEPVTVLLAVQLADDFSAAGSRAGSDGINFVDGECDVTDTRRVPMAPLD
jgi:hypothetical protein